MPLRQETTALRRAATLEYVPSACNAASTAAVRSADSVIGRPRPVLSRQSASTTVRMSVCSAGWKQPIRRSWWKHHSLSSRAAFSVATGFTATPDGEMRLIWHAWDCGVAGFLGLAACSRHALSGWGRRDGTRGEKEVSIGT